MQQMYPHDEDPRIFFNTEFCWPHGSHWICDFGGEEDSMIDAGHYIWTHDTFVPPTSSIRYDDYPATLEGTQRLYETMQRSGTPLSARTRFGILIQHQLRYTPVLNAYFQL